MDESLHDLLRTVFKAGATDVFLTEGQPPRIRTDGRVVVAHGPALSREILAGLWQECGLDPDTGLETDAGVHVPGIGRLRVNVYRTLDRLAAALRPIKHEIPSFDDLGLPADLLTSWIRRKSGLVLVTGPTGSGKSTTLAACLDWLNQHEARHVVTIEDPIEYLFENHQCFFSQREVRHDTANFADALRAALRQSPDVILVGEIRDAETAVTALRAAETGHLVLATLHSSGVVDTLLRLDGILEAAPDAATGGLLAQQLIGIISQQLLPRIDGGLVAILEYLTNEGATRQWITEGKHPELQDHLERPDRDESCSLLRYLIAATRQDILDPATARAASPRPQDFDRAMKGIS
jgi:pilus retraction protein PilT